MSQSRKHSMFEAILNVFSGMVLAFSISQLFCYFERDIQMYIYSDFHWQVAAMSNVIVTCILTVVSMVRGYFWRRLFNRHQVKYINKHYIKVDELHEDLQVEQLKKAIEICPKIVDKILKHGKGE